MVLHNSLDYGLNGYQVPTKPRATRSARVRICFSFCIYVLCLVSVSETLFFFCIFVYGFCRFFLGIEEWYK